ncbi:winged helix-turn-helix transcriptional regulator [Streptomyces caniscabiei]|uniref:winged helix-turn-helix transcriptional regulator n=1 Tax=Streptomyces caniscabiei TaxID=2746961 RepID=UPI0038F80826
MTRPRGVLLLGDELAARRVPGGVLQVPLPALRRSPPRVEYQLTPLGEGLRDVLDAMGTWAQAVPEPDAIA